MNSFYLYPLNHHFNESNFNNENILFVSKQIPTAKTLCLQLLQTGKIKERNITMNGKTTKKNTKHVSVISATKKLCCEILGYEGKHFILFYHKLVMIVHFYSHCFDVQWVSIFTNKMYTVLSKCFQNAQFLLTTIFKYDFLNIHHGNKVIWYKYT